MKENAVYKHGMYGDRNSMGKKAVSQKMNDYFPHQNLPAGDTNPNMQKNYLIQDASPIDTMGEYGMKQSKYLTEDGRAIDASKPEAQMTEAGTKQEEKIIPDEGFQKGYGYEKTITGNKGKSVSLKMTPNLRAKGQVYRTTEFSKDPEAGFRQPLVMGSEPPDNVYIETGGDTSLVNAKDHLDKASYTYTNKRGKEKKADVGTKKSKRLLKKFSKKLQKVRKSGVERSQRESNVYEKAHKKVTYNKGTYEANYRGQG